MQGSQPGSAKQNPTNTYAATTSKMGRIFFPISIFNRQGSQYQSSLPLQFKPSSSCDAPLDQPHIPPRQKLKTNHSYTKQQNE
jgi:hypothetical protein